jgi:hypothetical protein
MNRRLNFRLGLYETGREDERKYFGPEFDATPLDLLTMKAAQDEFYTRVPGENVEDFRLGIFIVEEEGDDE